MHIHAARACHPTRMGARAARARRAHAARPHCTPTLHAHAAQPTRNALPRHPTFSATRAQVIPEGQMHLLKRPLAIRSIPWKAPPDLPYPNILKVKGVSLDRQAAACGKACNALPRTELHGGVVRWGSSHRLGNASACCAACLGEPRCSVWVFCSNEARCGKAYRECWLKSKTDIWADKTLLVGTSDRWTAGTKEPAPETHPSGAHRPHVTPADAQLELVIHLARGDPLRLRLRLRGAAPRAAKRVHAMLSQLEGLHTGEGGGAGTACEGCEVLDAASVPETWGSDTVPDGLGEGERWPRGSALVLGTFGASLTGPAADTAGATSSDVPSAVPVEPSPIAVRRGGIAWASSGVFTGDGPAFFIALADQPQLGVSLTVWADVAACDLEALDIFAAQVEPRSCTHKSRSDPPCSPPRLLHHTVPSLARALSPPLACSLPPVACPLPPLACPPLPSLTPRVPTLPLAYPLLQVEAGVHALPLRMSVRRPETAEARAVRERIRWSVRQLRVAKARFCCLLCAAQQRIFADSHHSLSWNAPGSPACPSADEQQSGVWFGKNFHPGLHSLDELDRLSKPGDA